MDLTVFTAGTGAWEAPLVSALESGRHGVVVVRRCVDLPDLLSAAATGRAQAVLLGADLRRLDREALAILASAGLAVVGLHPPGEPEQAGWLRALGITHVLAADSPAADISQAVEGAVLELRAAPARTSNVVADPSGALPSATVPHQRHVGAGDDGDVPDHVGRVVAVWGPVGSPGRTTVAVTLAAELAALGESVLLVDADTYGASVAQALGVLDESPGLAAACRAATAGTLDVAMLSRLAPVVSPGVRVLTGISRSARWPEVGGAALAAVWPVARRLARWTVVDCGFCLERDEELSYDTAAPRRNAATLVSLEHADDVLAVGAGDPVGLQRLVRGLADLAEAVPTAAPRVVVNRARSSAVGASPQRRIADALGRYAGVQEVVAIPDDRESCDAALLAGRTLTEVAGTSPARRAVADLAASLAGAAPVARRSSGRWLLRTRRGGVAARSARRSAGGRVRRG